MILRAFVAGLALAVAMGGASAQQQGCRNGRTMQGTCANGAALDDARMTAILMSQPKFSKTNPPVEPAGDWSNPVLRDLTENRLVDHANPVVTRGNVRAP